MSEESPKIILVAETGADIDQKTADKYGIYIVPMHVTLGKETLEDGKFPVSRLYEFYNKTGKLPTTSAPNPEDYYKIFYKLHENFPEAKILHLCYSAATSASYQNSILASEDMPYVTHIDTKGVTAGQGSIVLRAAKLLKKNPDISLGELIININEWIKTSCMSFVPGSLAYLRAGGRVSNAAYLGASLLLIKPLIEIKNGELVSTKKYRGPMHKILEKVIKDFFREKNPLRDEIYLIASEGLSAELRSKIEKEVRSMGVNFFTWVKTGCVITTHCGPGAFGIAGFSA